jgi:protein-L-isoaspartate O-methyltransferase
LKVGGVLVAPVGDLGGQVLIRFRKYDNHVEQEELGEFVFSPLVGKHGFDEETVL